jgi:hypothetical protein
MKKIIISLLVFVSLFGSTSYLQPKISHAASDTEVLALNELKLTLLKQLLALLQQQLALLIAQQNLTPLPNVLGATTTIAMPQESTNVVNVPSRGGGGGRGSSIPTVIPLSVNLYGELNNFSLKTNRAPVSASLELTLLNFPSNVDTPQSINLARMLSNGATSSLELVRTASPSIYRADISSNLSDLMSGNDFAVLFPDNTIRRNIVYSLSSTIENTSKSINLENIGLAELEIVAQTSSVYGDPIIIDSTYPVSIWLVNIKNNGLVTGIVDSIKFNLNTQTESNLDDIIDTIEFRPLYSNSHADYLVGKSYFTAPSSEIIFPDLDFKLEPEQEMYGFLLIHFKQEDRPEFTMGDNEFDLNIRLNDTGILAKNVNTANNQIIPITGNLDKDFLFVDGGIDVEFKSFVIESTNEGKHAVVRYRMDVTAFGGDYWISSTGTVAIASNFIGPSNLQTVTSEVTLTGATKNADGNYRIQRGQTRELSIAYAFSSDESGFIQGGLSALNYGTTPSLATGKVSQLEIADFRIDNVMILGN